MKFFADLHIHSRYSRATSKELDVEHLWVWAQRKGIAVVGTGDFTHPEWLAELKEKLVPVGDGLYKLKRDLAEPLTDQVPLACRAPVRFMLSGEIANIYKRADTVRKVHNVVFAPSLEAASRIQMKLESIGNIRSDGRPILGLDSRILLEIVLESDPHSFLVPAHIWTPWFSAMGSKSGFDSIEECYGDLTKHIGAVETGLSSDPPMNRRVSSLDPFVLVSHSDAHSPSKLGREANIFETDLSYGAIYRALHDPSDRGLCGTIEFFPEEGKYHFDGHRKCGQRMHPRETRASGGLCPVCGRAVTVGVMARVEQLADRDEPGRPDSWRPHKSLIPLPEIIGDAFGVGAGSKRVLRAYDEALQSLGSEFSILCDIPLEEVRSVSGTLVAEGVRRVRSEEMKVEAGYDGEYGVVRIFDDDDRAELSGQTVLFDDLMFERSSAPETTYIPVVSEPMDRFREAHKLEANSTVSPSTPAMGELLAGDTRLTGLNAAQVSAVTHEGSHLLIVAGPGTGKTHTLTRRIECLTYTLKENESILAITFTNKAARELAERVGKRTGPFQERIFVGTFHRFALRILRENGVGAVLPECFRVATPEDCEHAAQTAWPDLSRSERGSRLENISRWKANVCRGEAPEGTDDYTTALRERGFVDFDDLLTETIHLLESNRALQSAIHEAYPQILVDEYQDVNAAQQAFLKAVVGPSCRLTAIGDPNQAIYGFRGSDVGFFHAFIRDFPGTTVVHLTHNYRNGAGILSAGGQVIKIGADPSVPELTSLVDHGGIVSVHSAVTHKAEAEFVVHTIERMVGGTSMFSHDSGRADSAGDASRSFGDFAVLYRIGAQQDALAEAFERSGMPYQTAGLRKPAEEEASASFIDALLLAYRGHLAPLRANRVVRVIMGFDDPYIRNRIDQSPEPSLAELKGIALNMPRLTPAIEYLEDLWDLVEERGLSAGLKRFAELSSIKKQLESQADARSAWHTMECIAEEKERDLYGFLSDMTLCRSEDVAVDTEHVSLMTLHAAKGLEFPVVFVVGCEKGLLPLALPGLHSDPEEERRLFYVGMTRAKEQLVLTKCKKRVLYGRTYEPAASPFLFDIEERLKRYEETTRPKGRAHGDAEQLSLF